MLKANTQKKKKKNNFGLKSGKIAQMFTSFILKMSRNVKKPWKWDETSVMVNFLFGKKAKYVFFVPFFAKDGKIWENCKTGRLENGQNTECIWRVPII